MYTQLDPNDQVGGASLTSSLDLCQATWSRKPGEPGAWSQVRPARAMEGGVGDEEGWGWHARGGRTLYYRL